MPLNYISNSAGPLADMYQLRICTDVAYSTVQAECHFCAMHGVGVLLWCTSGSPISDLGVLVPVRTRGLALIHSETS